MIRSAWGSSRSLSIPARALQERPESPIRAARAIRPLRIAFPGRCNSQGTCACTQGVNATIRRARCPGCTDPAAATAM